jgi:hypothetical protein
MSKAELPLVEIGTAMVTAKPARTDIGECGSAQQVRLHSPGYQQVESSTGTSVRSVAN